MRVLITNNTLAFPGGTERYILSLCRNLLRKGHSPIVYSTYMGGVAAELTRIGACVTDSLLDIRPPDIIHGHHHLDTTYALVCFPETPCINFCHGLIPWEELPAAKLSRIYTYVAISKITKEALLNNGVPEDKIIIIPNFVDEHCFSPNASLERLGSAGSPDNKMKALVYGNYPIRGIEKIEAACAACNYTIDKAGLPYGRSVNSPEILLPQFDVVFCYGKSAMESLYSGCHVILAHSTGTGAKVDEWNFDSLRLQNFGFLTCQDEPVYADICEKLTTITTLRNKRVTPISNAQLASLESAQVIEKLISTYRRTIHTHHQTRFSKDKQDKDRKALATYIQFLQKSRHAREISYSPLIDNESATRIQELECLIREADQSLKTEIIKSQDLSSSLLASQAELDLLRGAIKVSKLEARQFRKQLFKANERNKKLREKLTWHRRITRKLASYTKEAIRTEFRFAATMSRMISSLSPKQ